MGASGPRFSSCSAAVLFCDHHVHPFFCSQPTCVGDAVQKGMQVISIQQNYEIRARQANELNVDQIESHVFSPQK